jgi:hypothetical protein
VATACCRHDSLLPSLCATTNEIDLDGIYDDTNISERVDTALVAGFQGRLYDSVQAGSSLAANAI